MKLYSEAGLLYDALSYLNAHFSEEKLSCFNESGFNDIIRDLENLHIPRIIAPFFTGRHSLPAPIVEYLRMKSFDLCASIADLSRLLAEAEEQEHLCLITTYTLFYPDLSSEGQWLQGGEYAGTDSSMKTAILLDKTDLPAEFKYQALLCLTYFPHAAKELCRTISHIEDIMKKANEKYEAETDALFAEIRSGKYNKLYASSAGLELGIFNEITVSFSILHPELFLPVCRENNLILLVGKNHADALIRAFDTDKIDLAAFLEDMGNELRRMILETLSCEGELTASDISRLTGIPVTTAIRHMEALCDHYLIRISHRKGMQVFYTINREHLTKARRKANTYLQSLTGDLHEERDTR